VQPVPPQDREEWCRDLAHAIDKTIEAEGRSFTTGTQLTDCRPHSRRDFPKEEDKTQVKVNSANDTRNALALRFIYRSSIRPHDTERPTSSDQRT
jgi:hypothetical protein